MLKRLALASLALLGVGEAAADEADLARQAQNPIANLISLPFQNNTLFDVGPTDEVANVLNIQPVIPISLTDRWTLVTRTILPLIYLPGLFGGIEGLDNLPDGLPTGSTFGIGDINLSGFFARQVGPAFLGFGPSLTVPSASSASLGQEKWSMGPTVVGLVSKDKIVAGALVRQLWSFAGDADRGDVSQLLLQPFFNYNLPRGWYLVSGPIMTANWEKEDGQRWLVPVGGGVGKILRIGKQPINTSVQAYYNAVRPDFGPDWSLRVQVQFLFPR